MLALWFSATAILPALEAQHELDPTMASLFTSAVQLGFVAGTLISAVFGLADRIDPRVFFMGAAAVAAAVNAAILLVDPTSWTVIVLRFATGLCMAGVYPVGMKLASTWARGDMGFVIGLLVGALTLGSAAPHLFNALGGIDWRMTIGLASLSALAGAAAIRAVPLGPNYTPAPPFRPGQALKAWTTPALRLANIGYLGHMWELYAMWAWIGVFLHASFVVALGATPTTAFLAALATFATIAAGALGCIVGGLLADRIGRTTLTITAMTTSGVCAVLVGLLFGGDPVLLVLLCVIWGIAVIADSPQFSASVIELSERPLIGTMLTVQTCLGFLLTLATIHLIPFIVAVVGWNYAFSVLAVGPFIGVIAMWRLRHHPDSSRLAGGQR